MLNLCPLVVHALGAVQDSPPALKIRASRLLSHFRLFAACVARWDPLSELTAAGLFNREITNSWRYFMYYFSVFTSPPGDGSLI